MCGIFGLAVLKGSQIHPAAVKGMLSTMFSLSESRGKESAGLALRSSKNLYVHKSAVCASMLIRSKEYGGLLSRYLGEVYRDGRLKETLAIIGHARLVTDGSKDSNYNNQPVVKDGIVGIHNGIVTNVAALYEAHPEIERRFEVDTEVLLSLIGRYFEESESISQAVARTFKEMEGAASLALLFEQLDDVLLATNTGSLYVCLAKSCFAFASERFILETFTEKYPDQFSTKAVSKVMPGEACLLSLSDLKLKRFSIDTVESVDIVRSGSPARIVEHGGQALHLSKAKAASYPKPLGLEYVPPSKLPVRRCVKCILPETVPGIRFDESGLCTYCQGYSPQKLKGAAALRKELLKFKSQEPGTPDCIVAFSGGRDSSYGLDYIKRRLSLDPVAFTYDWGMVTDLARRNQARLCGKLGVEHILISADIEEKRANIRKNVNAWLKKPDLGMVPIFMAGDKMFFHYAHVLRRQTRSKVVVFCAGGEYEITDFKQGFCGVGAFEQRTMTALSFRNRMRILWYYIRQYIQNPAYINSSMIDNFRAFYSMFLLRDDYLYLYDYLEWNEEEIDKLLIGEYKWELATDTESTWRIGDGTAAFYNYIYYTVAGFSEFDYFRSGQIRRGALSRDRALQLVEKDNKPREESLRWYADIVGFDLRKAVRIINSMQKLYKADKKIINDRRSPGTR
jgi:glutamine---fructose-6-phosphate transaminase (isomerizing)